MELQTAGYFLFLGLVAVAHALLAPCWRIWLLLAASLFFYASASPGFLVLLLVLSTANYWAATRLSRIEDDSGRAWIFGGTLALNLAVLIAFKYLGPVVAMLAAQCGWRGGESGSTALRLAIPLGISYFTFQMIACVTDTYRREVRVAGGWGRFLLFGLFFPQITSGPIPRAGDLLPQLSAGVGPTVEDRSAGLRLIAYGLFKKFVVANQLSDYVSLVFDEGHGLAAYHYSAWPVLLACVYNTMALYADFSSYVDIARGSARLLGIHLSLNFDHPFTSTSVTEFWRRWHMTLSFWLRDYLYLPLLIRIRSLGMTGVVLALIFTFAVCGLWHGATWPYVCFGVAQGVAMSLELLTKRWRNRRMKTWPPRVMSATGWLYAMSFFVLSEIFFRAPSLGIAGKIYGDLFRGQPPRHLAELFVGRGPFNFISNLVAVGAWFAVVGIMRREKPLSTPAFAFVCAILILFLGHPGAGRFIYAGF